MTRVLWRIAIVAALTLTLAVFCTGIVSASMLFGPDDPASPPPLMPHPSTVHPTEVTHYGNP